MLVTSGSPRKSARWHSILLLGCHCASLQRNTPTTGKHTLAPNSRLTSSVEVGNNFGWLARLTLRVTCETQPSRADNFACMLAERAAEGDVGEIKWLIRQSPTDYSIHRQQKGVYVALLAAILSGQHAVCQLLLEWSNPSKEPMELPMCKYTDYNGQATDVTFLELAYEWHKIQGRQLPETAGHNRSAPRALYVQPGTHSGRPGYRLPSCPYPGMLSLLLEYKASLASSLQGLFQAIAWSADSEAIELLLSHGLHANACLADGSTLLHLLVIGLDWTGLLATRDVRDKIEQDRSKQLEEAVDTLLKAGASPVARNHQQKTPLSECYSGYTNIEAMLKSVQHASNSGNRYHGQGAAAPFILPTPTISHSQSAQGGGHPAVMVLAPCGHMSVGR